MADVESIQIVAFLKGTPSLNASVVWAEAFPGVAFANFLTPSLGYTSASAPFPDFQVELQCQAARIDLFVTPVPQQLPQPKPPSLVDFNAARTAGVEAFKNLLKTQDAARLAVVIVARELVNNEEDAVNKLSSSLEFNLKPGARDTSFQINIRKPSTQQPGLDFNRLCRWSAASMININVSQFVANAQLMTTGISSAIPVYVLQSYIDVNTDPAIQIDGSLREQLLDELSAEASSILNGGYGAL